MLNAHQVKLFEAVLASAAAASARVFVVGGVVRDIFLAHLILEKDFDFLIEGDAAQVAEACQKIIGGSVKRFPDFLTAKIEHPEKIPGLHEVDFATARTEIYQAPGKLPKVTKAKVEDDLKRRDFSINAMAIELSDLLSWNRGARQSLDDLWTAVFDAHGGREDLLHRRIRVLHEKSFIDDPTRMFRACRYAGRLDGSLEGRTEELLLAAVTEGALSTVSEFRRLSEIKKIAAERHFHRIMLLLDRYGVLEAAMLSDAASRSSFLSALSAIPRELSAKGQQCIFDVFILLAYQFTHPSERAARLKGMGLGAKHVSKLEKAVVELRNGRPSGSFSDEMILAMIALRGGEAESLAFAASRGLIVQ